MVRVPLFFTAYLFAVFSHADDAKELCGKVSDVAEVVMKKRQAGVSMKQLMENSSANEALEALVVAAYDSPRFSTEGMQAKSVEDFRDGAYLACIKDLRKR